LTDDNVFELKAEDIVGPTKKTWYLLSTLSTETRCPIHSIGQLAANLKGRDLKILSVWKIKHENTAWHLIQKEQDEMKEQASLCSLLFF
jgi:hypothetical protein